MGDLMLVIDYAVHFQTTGHACIIHAARIAVTANVRIDHSHASAEIPDFIWKPINSWTQTFHRRSPLIWQILLCQRRPLRRRIEHQSVFTPFPAATPRFRRFSSGIGVLSDRRRPLTEVVAKTPIAIAGTDHKSPPSEISFSQLSQRTVMESWSGCGKKMLL